MTDNDMVEEFLNNTLVIEKGSIGLRLTVADPTNEEFADVTIKAIDRLSDKNSVHPITLLLSGALYLLKSDPELCLEAFYNE